MGCFETVEYLVGRYYPDYSPLWSPDAPVDDALADLIREVFASHTEGLPSNARWGWKLCETAYILPVLDFSFRRRATSISSAMDATLPSAIIVRRTDLFGRRSTSTPITFWPGAA
jgi:hypothetical protein